jgi:hypothetical protein
MWTGKTDLREGLAGLVAPSGGRGTHSGGSAGNALFKCASGHGSHSILSSGSGGHNAVSNLSISGGRFLCGGLVTLSAFIQGTLLPFRVTSFLDATFKTLVADGLLNTSGPTGGTLSGCGGPRTIGGLDTGDIILPGPGYPALILFSDL